MDRGEVYLGPFLYSDLAGSKRRPICVVSSQAYNAGPDIIVAMVSSGARVLAPRLGDVVLKDWQQSGLLRPSVFRAGRLQVIERRLLSVQRGVLTAADLDAVDEALRNVLGLQWSERWVSDLRASFGRCEVRPPGFEPGTCGLRVRCSAIELEARRRVR